MDRRVFLTLCCSTPLLTSCASGYAVSRRDGMTLVLGGDALAARGWALVEHPTDEMPIAVLRDGAGVTALHTRCSHRGCQVEPDGTGLECPCHGSTFDVRGVALHGPAERPLTRYDVSVGAGEIRIHLDRMRGA